MPHDTNALKARSAFGKVRFSGHKFESANSNERWCFLIGFSWASFLPFEDLEISQNDIWVQSSDTHFQLGTYLFTT